MGIKEDIIKLLKSYGIIKSDKTEQMVSYEVVYEPDTKDSHGQWMSVETIEKACEDFNKYLKEGVVKSNLFHATDTETFTVVDTWVQKEIDVKVADTDEPIKAGTWVAKLQYHDDEVWQLKKAGVLGGVSIGGSGVVDEETGEISEVTFEYMAGNEDEE